MPKKTKEKTIKDSAFFAAIGRMGGNTTKSRMAKDYYSKIGKIGGKAVKDLYGRGYYSQIRSRDGKAWTDEDDARLDSLALEQGKSAA